MIDIFLRKSTDFIDKNGRKNLTIILGQASSDKLSKYRALDINITEEYYFGRLLEVD